MPVCALFGSNSQNLNYVLAKFNSPLSIYLPPLFGLKNLFIKSENVLSKNTLCTFWLRNHIISFLLVLSTKVHGKGYMQYFFKGYFKTIKCCYLCIEFCFNLNQSTIAIQLKNEVSSSYTPRNMFCAHMVFIITWDICDYVETQVSNKITFVRTNHSENLGLPLVRHKRIIHKLTFIFGEQQSLKKYSFVCKKRSTKVP